MSQTSYRGFHWVTVEMAIINTWMRVLSLSRLATQSEEISRLNLKKRQKNSFIRSRSPLVYFRMTKKCVF